MIHCSTIQSSSYSGRGRAAAGWATSHLNMHQPSRPGSITKEDGWEMDWICATLDVSFAAPRHRAQSVWQFFFVFTPSATCPQQMVSWACCDPVVECLEHWCCCFCCGYGTDCCLFVCLRPSHYKRVVAGLYPPSRRGGVEAGLKAQNVNKLLSYAQAKTSMLPDIAQCVPESFITYA